MWSRLGARPHGACVSSLFFLLFFLALLSLNKFASSPAQPSDLFSILLMSLLHSLTCMHSTPVAVLALGSGLVTWPSGFTCVWDALEGIALWMPVPPPGFVALGCCASVDHGVPPPLQGVCACVVSVCFGCAEHPAKCIYLSSEFDLKAGPKSDHKEQSNLVTHRQPTCAWRLACVSACCSARLVMSGLWPTLPAH